MSIFTFHIAHSSFGATLNTLLFPPSAKRIPGLIHAECLASMTLGSPLFSMQRILMNKIEVFAQWEDEESIDRFLSENKLGQKLSKGWHTRLTFVRQWGKIDEFNIPKETIEISSEEPVVAVTLARMKLSQVPRFIQWGRPVEKLVRDHPGKTLSTAGIRLPNTVSTFSIWKNKLEMDGMVHGHSSVKRPKRHSNAMVERERKDFHFQFTTLRFKPISEHGSWMGKSNYIFNLSKS